jgi:hypothetical protein
MKRKYVENRQRKKHTLFAKIKMMMEFSSEKCSPEENGVIL